MKTLILLILLLPILTFGQLAYYNAVLFPTATDTCADYDTPDTLDWRVYAGGVAPGAWNVYALADTITLAQQRAEATLVLDLSNETGWTWGEMLDIRIRSGASVCGTGSHRIGQLQGAISLFIVPDTVLTNTYTDYSGSRIGGN